MAVEKRLPHLKKITTFSKKSQPKSVAELKKKFNHLPLHFLFGIEKEIEHQCPLLDEYLNQLEEVKAALEKIRKSKTLEQAQIHAATGLHFISNLPADIDLVTRCNFEKLRKTGEDWKQLAITAINETKSPEKFLKI